MNVELLESVRDAIVFHPEQFCAAQWAFARNTRAVLDTGARPEGFKCCIAGHALLQSGRYSRAALLRAGGFHDGVRLWPEAGQVLDLTVAQRDELFFPSQWDSPYKQRYYLCRAAEEAEIAGAYIDYFVSMYADPAPENSTPGQHTDRDSRRVPAEGPAIESALR